MLSMVHSDSAMPIPKPAEKHPRARGWRRCAGTPGRIADFMRSSDRTSAPLAYVLDHDRRATMAQFSRDREPCLPIRLPGDPPRVVPRRTARGRGARAARGIRVFFENTIRAETGVQRPKPLRFAPAKSGLVSVVQASVHRRPAPVLFRDARDPAAATIARRRAPASSGRSRTRRRSRGCWRGGRARAVRRTRRSRRRRGRRGGVPGVPGRGSRGTGCRGSRPRLACGRRNSGVSGHSEIAPKVF